MKSAILKTSLVAAIAGLGLAQSHAHFMWLFYGEVPSTVTVQFGESPNDSVLPRFVGKQQQFVSDRVVRWGEKNGTIYGAYSEYETAKLPYAVMNRGGTYFLYYHAKASRNLKAAALRTDSLAELTATERGNEIVYRMFLRGRQVTEVDFQYYDAKAKATKVKGDANGELRLPKTPERIAIWGVTNEPVAGSFQGKAFPSVRHYATLTVPAPSSSQR